MSKKTLKISAKNNISCKKTSEIIKNGGIAIVPTETVYGFAVDAFNIEAQKTVYRIKGRNYKNPLILMISDIKNLMILVKISKKGLEIVRRFWPGQLTLIFPTTDMGKILSGGRKDLGVRIPNNEFMLELLKEIDGPIFTTSVNISTEKSSKNIDEVLDFDGIVDIIIDGGRCEFSSESTIIDMVQFPYVVIRDGCLDANKLLKYI